MTEKILRSSLAEIIHVHQKFHLILLIHPSLQSLKPCHNYYPRSPGSISRIVDGLLLTIESMVLLRYVGTLHVLCHHVQQGKYSIAPYNTLHLSFHLPFITLV